MILVVSFSLSSVVSTQSVTARAGHTPLAQVVFAGTYGDGLVPAAINDKGVVAGAVWKSGILNTFLWSEGKGFRTVFEGGYARDINNKGDLVGIWSTCFVSDCPSYGFLLTSEEGFHDFGDFLPARVNERRDIAGVCWTAYVPCAIRHHVFEQGDLAGTLTGINDRGDAVGPGIVWRDRGNLNTVAGEWYDINDRGTLAGSATIEGVPRPAIQMNGRLITFPVNPSLVRYGYASSINGRGEVVGAVDDRAFYWNTKSGAVIVFSDAVPGQYSSVAYDINNRGEIVGYAQGPGVLEMIVWRVR